VSPCKSRAYRPIIAQYYPIFYKAYRLRLSKVLKHINTLLPLLLFILIIIIKMNLFDNLSDKLEWSKVDFLLITSKIVI
jgi:hypothetical protein